MSNSSYIRSVDRRLKRIRFHQAVGRFIYRAIVVICLMMIVSHLNTVMMMQKDTLDQINDYRVETQQAIDLYQEPITEPVNLSNGPENIKAESYDKDLVERVVASEARGETLEGMMAVAQTIRDRADCWNMTIEEVCLAPSQYAKPFKGKVSADIKVAVSEVFEKGTSVLEVPTTHFASNDPYWAKGKINRGSFGRHNFYY